MTRLDHNSVAQFVAIIGGGGGIAGSVIYIAKKTVDLGFELLKHYMEKKQPAPPVILYDPYDRIMKR